MSKINLYTHQHLDALREQQDTLADQAVQAILVQKKWVEIINGWKVIPQTLPSEFPLPLKYFFNFYLAQKYDCDPPVCKKAQSFFSEFGLSYLSMLSFYSLPYTYAFANGAQVLASSRRIIDDVGKRLAETGLFLMEVFRPRVFYEKKEVLLTISKVRLIHAFSRYFVSRFHPSWKQSWGRPVNQEDMLGTNLAFSLLVIRGMRKMGTRIAKSEVDALMAYWRMVGYYLGLEVEYWPENAKESFLLEKTIRDRQMKGSEAGRLLINSLMGHFQEQLNNPIVLPFLEDVISFFIGPQAAKALGLKLKPSFPSSIIPVILQSNSFEIGKRPSSYKELRYFFESEGRKQFKGGLSLNLPYLHDVQG